MGICGHIYYLNKKRQFLNSLWPFCMIKINLALINLVILHFYRTKRTKFSTQCKLLCNFKRCKKNPEPTRSQKTKPARSQKKWRDLTAQLELGFLLGPTPPFFFCGVSDGRAAEHNQQDRLSRIAPWSNDAEPSLWSNSAEPARSQPTEFLLEDQIWGLSLGARVWSGGWRWELGLGETPRGLEGFWAGQRGFEGFDWA